MLPQTHRSRCKGQRTATLGLTAPSESFCKDLSEPLTKSDEGNLFLFLSGTQSAGLLRVLRGEQRENWHGGELLQRMIIPSSTTTLMPAS